jgi:hypothetical protein
LVALTACETPQWGGGKAIPIATEPVFTPRPTVPIAPPPETIAAPTLVANPTPVPNVGDEATPDTRLPPERWQEWPVVPSVTARAIEIYRTGQTMGLDPRAFSKVGDCQSVKDAFMGYIDLGQYPSSLGSDYLKLQETIDNFAGHFNTDGQAVRGGFNAASVLSPLWADPHACLPGENPLECELRITRPIIVIVRMEIWWDGRTSEQYNNLMRRILDTIIAHGAVPILATKADNVEGDNSLNLTTAKLAYEYGLPLWNFWAAVQPMPAHGMETTPPHNDGFHISEDAWNEQSLTGLQALDSVWHGLLDAAPAAAAISSPEGTRTVSLVATPGAIATSAPNLALTATPTAGATPAGSSNRIVFGLAQRQGEGYEYQGVYLLDLTTRQTRQVFGSGVRFQSASPDGKYILVSEGSALYRANVDGAFPLQISDSLYAFGDTDAVWLPSGQIAAILTKPGGTGISILSADGVLVSELSVSDASPVELFPDSDGSRIYWESGSCTSPGVCERGGAWVTSLGRNLSQALTGITEPLLAPDGSLLAYTYPVSASESDLGLASPDGSNPRQFSLPGNLLIAYAWSPAGDELAVVVADRSDYSGKVSGNRNFLVDPRSQAISEYAQSQLLNARVLWSPDGAYLFWLGTLPTEAGFMIGGSLVDRLSKQVTDLNSAIGQSGADYLLVTNAVWLPLP